MNYITTNIQIPEEDYGKLTSEAAKRRTSLSELIGEKIGLLPQRKVRSKAEVEKILAATRKAAAENAKYTKGFDSLKALREIRYAK